MAFLAGFSDVVLVDRGVFVGMRQNIMGGVAIGADRGYGQSLLKQTLAMNTERIMRQDAVLGNVVSACYLGALFMAFPAHIRDVEFGYARIG
jgi:hypothetical protein